MTSKALIRIFLFVLLSTKLLGTSAASAADQATTVSPGALETISLIRQSCPTFKLEFHGRSTLLRAGSL